MRKGVNLRQNNKNRKSKLKDLTGYVQGENKKYAEGLGKVHKNKDVNAHIWATK